MFQNLLFDLDGTLTNSAEGITKCVQYALNSLNINEPDLKKLNVFIGPPLLDSFMEYYGLTKEQSLFCVEKYRERYTDIGIWENRPYAGILELLQDLKQDERKIGMATAKPEVFAVRIAERYGMNPYMEDITGCDLEGKMNDKALVVAKALEKWNITTPEAKAKTFLIGDREHDVFAAHANDIPCIGVGYGFAHPGELKAAKVDYYAKDLNELRKLLLG